MKYLIRPFISSGGSADLELVRRLPSYVIRDEDVAYQSIGQYMILRHMMADVHKSDWGMLKFLAEGLSKVE
jgi:hypothetical protein